MSSDLENRVQRLLDFGWNDNKQKRTRSGAYSLPPHNRMKIGRVIRAANERPRSDVEEPLPACDVPVIIELLWSDVFNDGQMLCTRTKILAHRQHFAASLA